MNKKQELSRLVAFLEKLSIREIRKLRIELTPKPLKKILKMTPSFIEATEARTVYVIPQDFVNKIIEEYNIRIKTYKELRKK